MPEYEVTNDEGITLIISGDQPPNEKELNEIFSQYKEQQVIDRPIAENPILQKNITEKSIRQDTDWINAAKSIYFWDKGKDAKPLASDKDYAEWGLNYMGNFNYNLVATGIESAQILNADDKQKKDFITLMDMYDFKESSLEGLGRFAKGVITDPTTYAGAGLFAKLGFAGSSKQAAKEALKKQLKENFKKETTEQITEDIKKQFIKKGTIESVKKGATLGSLEGAAYAGADNTFRQNARINANVQDEFDYEQLLKATALGSSIGATLGGGISGIGGNIGARSKFNEVLQREQPGIQNPNIKTDDLNVEIPSDQPKNSVDLDIDTQIKEPFDVGATPSKLVEAVQPLPEAKVTEDLVDPGFLGARYQKVASQVLDFVKKPFTKFGTYGDLPKLKKYLTLRGLTGGKLENVRNATRDVYEFFSKVSSDENAAARQYLLGDTNALKNIKNKQTIQEVKKLRNTIDFVGQSLVNKKILSKDVFNKNKGTYLPRMYLKYLDKKGTMDYTKTRKDLDNATLDFLGEVKDVSLLGSKAIEEPISDIIKLNLFEQLAKESEWVFRPGLINFRNKEVTPFWLKEERDRLANEIVRDGRDPIQGQKIIKEIDEAIDKAEINISKENLSKFKQVPDSKKYGTLRGAYIRKEIYDDLIASGQMADINSNWFASLFAPTGALSKFTKFWKMTKVALNPPTQVRNFISNMMLTHLSGISFTKVPTRYLQAIKDIKDKGPYSEIAKKYGITGTTFSRQEMLDLNAAYRKAIAKKTKNPVDTMRWVAESVSEKASNLYQKTEVIGKVAVIIDKMSKGADEATAALAANKALFDYSAVPAGVRYLRNAPIGVPFLTFYYKVLPNLLETAVRYPERYLPYVAIPYALTEFLTKPSLNIDQKDLEIIQNEMPKWVKDAGSAYILPVKDENDKWVAFDYSYLLPWSMWTGISKDIFQGEFAEAFGKTGILGGPVPELITVFGTNTDRFTGRKISNEYDPAGKQLADQLNYFYRMAAPPWLTDRGFAGKMLQAINNDIDRSGQPRTTIPQAAGRLFGLNFYTIDPARSRRQNIDNMEREIVGFERRMKEQLRDKNLTTEEKANIKKQYKELIDQRKKQLKEYIKESQLTPKLK